MVKYLIYKVQRLMKKEVASPKIENEVLANAARGTLEDSDHMQEIG
jgi:sensor domain CHASE-containing protein